MPRADLDRLPQSSRRWPEVFMQFLFFGKSKKFQMVIYLSVCLSPAILPQNATKFTKMCSSEFGGLLWCHLTTQRKTAIGVHNYSPSRAQQSKKSFEKFTSCILLVHTNLCITSHFWTTNVNYDNCCQQGYIVTSGNFLYSCTSTFQALKYCSGIFLNLCYTK